MVEITRLLWLLNILVPILYLAALAAYTLVFFTDQPFAKRVARPLLIAAVFINLLYHAFFTAHFEHIPLVSVSQVMGGVGFALAAVYLWIENQTQSPYTGPFVLSLAFVCELASSLNPRHEAAVPEVLRSVLFSLHVSAAVLAYSAFALAAVYGLIYLLLYTEMRSKTFGIIYRRLPSLAVLDKMNLIATFVGFGFITVAMALGFVWSVLVFKAIVPDPKLIVGIITWTAYGLTLYGRKHQSFSGTRLAYSSLFGFVLLLGTMMVVNFFFTKFHMFK